MVQALTLIGMVIVTATFFGSLFWFIQLTTYIQGLPGVDKSGMNVPFVFANVLMIVFLPPMGYVLIKIEDGLQAIWRYLGRCFKGDQDVMMNRYTGTNQL